MAEEGAGTSERRPLAAQDSMIPSAHGLLDEQAAAVPDIGLIAADIDAETEAFGLAVSLRQAGLSCVMLLKGNMGKKMKAANRLGCASAVIAGSDELRRGTVSVRSMADGEQFEVEISKLTTWLSERLSKTS